jgi:putative phosphoesterase
MKALIFSDSHGNSRYMKKIIKMSPDAQYVFFLGDGTSEIDELTELFPEKIFYAVKGNNDWSHSFFSQYKDELVIELEGKRIFLTHGHNYRVKGGEQSLYYRALALGADVVLFGHTHTPCERYVGENEALYMFNPGSIGIPDVRGNYSFGCMSIKDGQILLSHGSVKNEGY